MAGPEATIERWVTVQARARYGVESVKWGQDGWPDRVFLLPEGKPLLIEFKAPGGVLSPRQKHRIEALQRVGYDVQVHDDRERALAAIAWRLALHYQGIGHNG